MSRLVTHMLVGSLLIIFVATQAVGAGRTVEAPLPSRVESLIQRLRARNYSQRQWAASELRHIGYDAIDQLLEAQYDTNSEISLAAQHLVGQLPLKWTRPEDPKVVTYAMRDYHKLTLEGRSERSRWLAGLEDGIGFDAVCRIVRYDPSEILAKQAALQLIEFLDQEDPQQEEAFAAAIRVTLGPSQRQPAKWLRATHGGMSAGKELASANLMLWKQLADEEAQLVDSPRSTTELSRALLELLAIKATDHNSMLLAREAWHRVLRIDKDTPLQLLHVCHEMLDHGQTVLFKELVFDGMPDLRADDPQIVYCAAEAELQQGKDEKAEQLAEQAFSLTANEARFADPIETAWLRFQIAINLESRGMTEWAIREYQRIIDMKMTQWRMSAIRERAARLLAELLHDRQREKEAAETLAQLIEGPKTITFGTNDLDQDDASIVSRMYYFRSEQFRLEANREKQMEFLRKGIQADPTDADVLIAMHGLPRASSQWQEETTEGIQKAVDIFSDRLQRLRTAGVVANRFDIATQLNQIAWLVGNTDGDQQKAVEQSRGSLDLRPQSAGSLDTLGRAYFAGGDLKNALKYQRRAAKLEPHSQQIRRQLVQFELALSQAAQKPVSAGE